MVNVLRDEATVFDPAAVRTFIGKPITDDHPSVAVTADNWRDHGRGVVMGALRDGDHLAFDLLLMDGPTIAKVEGGKRQISNGYAASVEFGDFTAPDGTKCQARQARISDGNHVAIVDRARGGETCCIAACDSIPLPSLNTEKPAMKTMLVDGLTVDMANADTAIATVTTLRDARDAAKAALATAEAKAVTDAAAIVTKDAEIAKLTADKAALEAAKPTPAQLRDAAKAYGAVVAKGKAAGITVTDAMGEDEIKKAVVDKMMPGNTYTADHIGIAFDALTKDAKIDATDSTIVPIPTPTITTDADKSRTAFVDRLQNAWKPAAAA